MADVPKWAVYTGVGLGLGALGAGVALLWPMPLPLCRGWVDVSAPAQIRAIARPIERMTNLKGLGDFLSGVAWIESRGNPRAGSDEGNRARGMYGMRPKSARVADLGLPSSALKDLPTATALAAWYIHRCIPWADEDQDIDWLALRRCWGYPKDVDDVDHPGYWKQFARGLTCAGVDPNFMYKKAIRWNYTWPGIDAILAAVGRPRFAAVAA
ncbi:MAG: hypothetical protein K0U16_07255 [Gammaproteobacteria bacterium]|nr:hypothetical protein [Gammaproteobacteria bacterium]